MRIAHLLPAGAVFPLRKHNGRYEWALRLAKYQTANGHDVTIFSGTKNDSEHTDINWQSVEKLSNKRDTNEALVLSAFKQDFDIYHSHFDTLGCELANQSEKPVVTTQHWFPDEEMSMASAANTHRNHFFVPVTDYMAEADCLLGIQHSERIYHGIDLSLFKQTTTPPSPRYIYAGRISPGKGVKEAVEISAKANIELDIIGKINEEDRLYWKSFNHLVDGKQIRYIGQVSHQQLVAYFNSAKGFIFPAIHTEAFGQTIIEAQACGCPVIISDNGANSELVLQGSTGFVCSTESDYLQAIDQIGTINRSSCRQNAEKFDVTTMVEAYESLYEKLLKA